MATSSPSEDIVQKVATANFTDATPTPSLTLLTLPYDVRLQIYKAILVSRQNITPEARKYLFHEPWSRCGPSHPREFHRSMSQDFDTTKRLEDELLVLESTINVKFLRTCRALYEEALPVLCSQNAFFFTGRATTKLDLDRLISERARAHLAFVQLHPADHYLNQICQPRGPIGDFDTLWQGLCCQFTGIRRITLNFVPNDKKRLGDMSKKFVRFMMQISVNMDYGCRTDLLPNMVAKVEVGKGGDRPAPVLSFLEPHRELEKCVRNIQKCLITTERRETLYTPRGARIELNAVLARSTIEMLAEACEGRWTSPDLNNGLLNDMVTVGSVVEMTLTKFRTTATLYDGPVLGPNATSRPVWDGYDSPSYWSYLE